MTKTGAYGRVTEKNDGDQSKREWSYSMATSGCRAPPWACAAENPVTRLLLEEHDAKGQRCSSARIDHRPGNGPWQVNAKREKSRPPSNLISIRPRALETKRGIQTIVRWKARHCLHPQNG